MSTKDWLHEEMVVAALKKMTESNSLSFPTHEDKHHFFALFKRGIDSIWSMTRFFKSQDMKTLIFLTTLLLHMGHTVRDEEHLQCIDRWKVFAW